jgi:hypothetical protein
MMCFTLARVIHSFYLGNGRYVFGSIVLLCEIDIYEIS